MRTLAVMIALLGLGLGVGACGGDASDDAPKGGEPAAKVTPSKEAVVALLKDLAAATKAGELDKAMGYLVPFGGLEPQQIPELVKREGVTPAAIDLVASKGKFGPLAEVFPERGAYFAKKAGVELKDCYALRADPAEIAVHFDGTKLRFIRIDDLHKVQ